jgi:DNA-binding PadR family transcriptional regulator
MTIKRLNEVMRNPKLYAQTKAIYSYLYVRADHKTNLAYPPKKQILDEIRLTEPLLEQGLAVLEKQGYIKIGTAEGTNKKTKETYTYTTYQLLDTPAE